MKTFNSLFIVVLSVLFCQYSLFAQDRVSKDVLPQLRQALFDKDWDRMDSLLDADFSAAGYLRPDSLSLSLAQILCEAGYELSDVGMYERASGYLQRAYGLCPDDADNGDLKQDIAVRLLLLKFEDRSILPDSISESLSQDHSGLMKAVNAYINGDKSPWVGDILIEHIGYYKLRLPEQAGNYLYLVNFLAQLYRDLNELGKADGLYAEAIGVIDKYAPGHPGLRFVYQNYGLLYYSLSNIQKTIEYEMKAKSLYEQLGDKGIGYANCLSNLASCYLESEDFGKAKMYLDVAVSLTEQSPHVLSDPIFGSYIQKLSNRGLLFYQMGLPEDAVNQWLEVIQKCEMARQYPDAFYGSALNLSTCYATQGDYQKAVRFLDMCTSGSPRDYYKTAQGNRIGLYTLQGQDSLALEAYHEYYDYFKSSIYDVFSHFSRDERRFYWVAESDMMLSIVNAVAFDNAIPSAKESAVDFHIFMQNLQLESNRLFEELVNLSGDPLLRQVLRDIRLYENKLKELSLHRDSVNLYRELISQKERWAYTQFNDFGELLAKRFGDFRSMKQNLQTDEAVVLFSIMKPFAEDSYLLIAYVVTKDAPYPSIVRLSDFFEISDVIEKAVDDDSIDELYSGDTGQKLYQWVWAGLEPYLANIKTIRYVPMEILHRLSFAAIPLPEGGCLSDKYDLNLVSSCTGECLSNQAQSWNNVVVYGGIQYEMSDNQMISSAEKAGQPLFSDQLVFRANIDRGSLMFLPGSEIEAVMVRDNLNARGIPVSCLTGMDASEESFKCLDGHSPSIIHMATHGFAVSSDEIYGGDESVMESFGKEAEYMNQSGVLMAGSNRSWTGRSLPAGVEDGILTSSEIAGIDLSQTRLVVLSSCDSGLGFTGLDGVVGLQRGFKRAGAGSILMSLWKVDDQIAAEWMSCFYRNLSVEQTVRSAYNKTLSKMQKRYPNPSDWAGFVLLD